MSGHHKITVVCHKDHSKGYEDFEGKCLLCVIDTLMFRIGDLLIQKCTAEEQAESYKELMDATAKDADKAYALLRRAETEMRYAGWNRLLTDNHARKDIYDDIKEFLK